MASPSNKRRKNYLNSEKGLEIEGKSVESVQAFLERISYEKEKLTTLDVESVYQAFYGIDPDDYPNLTFETKKK